MRFLPVLIAAMLAAVYLPASAQINTPIACTVFTGFPLNFVFGTQVVGTTNVIGSESSRCASQKIMAAMNTLAGQRGIANGIATLGPTGTLPLTQFPPANLLTPIPSGRKAVEQGQADDLKLAGATLVRAFGHIVNPYSYGYFDGANPAQTTAAIQAALNTGKSVDLLDKVWNTAATLVLTADNQYLFSRSGKATIVSTVSAGDIIQIGGGPNYVINSGLLGGIRIWSTATKAAGTYAVRATKLARGTIDARVGPLEEQTAMGNPLYNGLGLDTNSLVTVTGNVAGYRHYGRSLWSTENACTEINLYGIANGGTLTSSYADAGDVIGGGCGGINLRDGGSQANLIGTKITQELANIANREVFLHPGYSPDSNTLRNLVIEPNGVYYFSALGIYSGGAGALGPGYNYPADTNDANGKPVPAWGVGIEIQSPQINRSQFNFEGSTIVQNMRDGFIHWAGTLRMNGIVLTNNGTATQGGSGYVCKYTSTSGLVSSGSIVDRNGLTADQTAPTAHGAGYDFESGCDNFTVQGGSARGNSSGGTRAISGFGPTRVFNSVQGFTTRVMARFGMLAGGGNTMTIGTGLNITPSKFIAFPDSTTNYQPIVSWKTNPTNPANIDITFAGNVTVTQGYSYIAEY